MIVTDCDLRAEHVSKRYGEVTALAPVSLAVSGDAVVLGPPGSGKSVLARLLAGRERPTGGTVTFNGEDLADLLRTRSGRFRFHTAVGYVGPDSAALFDPRRSLRDGLRLPLRVRYRMSGLVADERIDATLGDLGLTDALADRRPGEVSGAGRRRFALARALVIRPRLLLCDGLPGHCGLSGYWQEHGLHLVLFARSLSGLRPMNDQLAA